MKSRRFFQILKPVLLLGMAGLVYGIFVRYTGLAIPCFFNKVTGFYCPGCGVTRMCVALLQFHFREAFYANPVIFCMLPVFLLVFLTGAVRYVKDGIRELPQGGPEYSTLHLYRDSGAVWHLKKPAVSSL